MGTILNIDTPRDYDLARDVCSYGYFLLAPNDWSPADQAFRTTLDLTTASAERQATTVVVRQPSGRGGELVCRFDRMLDRAQQTQARARLTRMLRLDESREALKAFHRVDPRWRRSGRGRLFRSPTMFEDVIKTITSCNVAWPNTINMNERLCEVLGSKSPSGFHAFPSPAKLARTRPGTLRGRCRVGYRDTRIIAIAKLFKQGSLSENDIAAPSRTSEEVYKDLLALPGVGPYAAANIMQLLGRYDRLALDTESVRHGRSTLGFTGEPPQVLKMLEAHYDAFGAQRFRSYWLELWDDYEARRGPAHTWERETTGRTFTSVQLRD